MADDARSQWLRGTTELLVLAELGEGRSYGYELVERLQRAGITDLSEATVYGVLRRMESQGLLSSHLAASDRGPARKYYEVTVGGRRARKQLAAEWTDFAAVVGRVIKPINAKQRGAS